MLAMAWGMPFVAQVTNGLLLNPLGRIWSPIFHMRMT
jgi:hypothetical protein